MPPWLLSRLSLVLFSASVCTGMLGLTLGLSVGDLKFLPNICFFISSDSSYEAFGAVHSLAWWPSRLQLKHLKVLGPLSGIFLFCEL